LNQNPGTVAGVRFGSRCASVIKIGQTLQPKAQHFVVLAAMYVDHEPNAARIVFESRVVKALGLGQLRTR